MIRLLEQTGGKLIATKATEKLTTADFDKIMPLIEERSDEYVKLKWYFEGENFDNWKPKGVWDELKFDYAQSNLFEKIALVGNKDWKKWLKDLMKPFGPDEMRFFESSQREEAMEWING